jgi:hypothetical protein
MSHAGMTESEMMIQYRKELREGQLNEEYRNFNHYNLQFTSPDGNKHVSFSMGELFDMFELQRQKKTTYL